MSLPIDIILVRHGQAGKNRADEASREGDNSFFTPSFRNQHSHYSRLTDKGIMQAKAAGDWLKANVPMPLDCFDVSINIRAKETAGHLGLPHADWREEFDLRERDLALMDNRTVDEKRRFFILEMHKLNPVLSYPAGGGESIAKLCERMKTSVIPRWVRKCSGKRLIAACHGHVMRAFQIIFEDLGHDDFIRLDSSKRPEDQIRNGQIMWYTRRNPETGEVLPYIYAVRSVCPLNSRTGLVEDFGWRRIAKNKRYSNEDLLEEVSKYPRHIS